MKEKNGAVVLSDRVNDVAAGLPHNRYHRAARSSAAMAIVYAAMAGRELIEERKKIKHGRWLSWVEVNCEFSAETAWRYVELANKLKAKLLNLAHVQDLNESPESARARNLGLLLDRPPSQLLPAETETLLKDLREATKGQTLRQLYFDFGIATQPKALGGANHLRAFLREHFPDHPEYLDMPLRDLPKEVDKEWRKHLVDSLPAARDLAERYREIWSRLIQELREHGLDKKTYAFLKRDEIEGIYGSLIDLKKEFAEVLKK